MRRTTVLATALVTLVALAAGAAGCSGGDDEADATAAATAAVTAPASGEPSVPVPTTAGLEATLKSFTAAMRRNPYGHSPARLSALRERVDALAAQLTALEETAGTRDGEPSPATVRTLREAEAHLREYLRHGAEADEIEMQREIYRYLWSLNRLPEELGQV